MTTTQIEIIHVPIETLRPDSANPRRISDEELGALTRSIREFGFVDPVIARREGIKRTGSGPAQSGIFFAILGLMTSKCWEGSRR